MIKVSIEVRNENCMPERKTEGSSGYDIKAYIDSPVELLKGEIKLIPTGIRVQIPSGYEAQIRSRSGLALKGVFVLNSPGTIDSDYRGEIKVILINLGEKTLTINPFDRIAQMVFQRVYDAQFVFSKLDKTKRNSGGFGHTGL
ncbi:deoxyuridine 5'-triphosphate nucleotidohydrolase Dut [Thermodesulfobium narugense DSM 14796]|uniref:dUTP diphosphatase n=1 Tax=Thermodesulfobium narugense DSM 14796 TaxID=747365 RepID=M1E7K9_9BACT|nr:dUTP diphosphatase [Thermodesulfobium narugense]AEE14515.1 deoxyuridine 5'-triphosphate nucleotidohydrolase Dut [Thermodesulfobium narugense DSM 14796]